MIRLLLPLRICLAMNRFLLWILFVGACFCSAAQEFAVLERGVDFVNYHVRVKAASRGASVLSLYWNYSDSSNYRCARVFIPSSIDCDKSGGALLKCVLGELREGEYIAGDEFRGSAAYVPGSAEVSAVLKYADCRGVLEIGSRGAEMSVPVEFDGSVGGSIGAGLEGRGEIVRNTLLNRYIEPEVVSQFGNEKELEEYIAASDDKREAVWEYMDRDFKNASVSYEPGVLASVSDGAGGYVLVAVEEGASPLLEKGRMYPTVFENNFDLRWHTADGPVIERESNATFELEDNVLRLSFPAEGATIRFRRRVLCR